MSKSTDEQLLEALTNAYSARAKLFHTGVRASKIDLLIAEIDAYESSSLDWQIQGIGISNSAINRIREANATPQQVFAHPRLIRERPHLVAYYRNIATISRKGIGQILFPTDRFESGKMSVIEEDKALLLCRTLNQVISNVIDADPNYSVDLSRKAAFAEIGTELQGTWANVIGKGAAKEVEKLFSNYLSANESGEEVGKSRYLLDNGWRLAFSSEPDVSFFDAGDVIQIAIEIKGSLDKAAAQTRYGETKKSFAKALSVNTRCHTIYLASCFTSAVIDQLKSDGQVRSWFNLTSILYDDEEKQRFLDHVFHIVNAPR